MSSRSGSDSESGSESEEEQFESIIATRERRSNAGSRLRQLIQLEEEELEEQTNSLSHQFTTEDDENVNLLFQEDADDGEFVESDSDEDNEEDEEDEEGQKEQEQKKIGTEAEEEEEEGEGGDDDDDSDSSSPAVDSDEMLSESDMSDSDTDESEGERELRKEEKERIKRQAKNSKIPAIKNKITSQIPAIKKHISSPVKKKRPAVANIDLLSAERRSSSRKTTVENKVATAKKLQEQEERRVTMTPKVQVEYVEKTLEERLIEAEETEKQNTLSLNRFFEQEVDRKKKQREAALSRKKVLTEFIRTYSRGQFITPMDEVAEINKLKRKEEEELERIAKRKKRYGKKKKVVLETTENNEGEVALVPSTINGDLKPLDAPTDGGSNVEETKLEVPKSDDVTPEVAVGETETERECDQETKVEVETKTESTQVIPSSSDVMDVDTPAEEAAIVNEEVVEAKDDEPATNDAIDSVAELESMEVDTKPEPVEAESNESESIKEELIKAEEEVTDEIKEKKVTFADEETETGSVPPEDTNVSVVLGDEAAKVENDKTKETDTVVEEEEVPEEPKILYEGPSQYVTVNYISLEEFGDVDLDTDDVKIKLLGEQSTWPATRRSTHVENICIIKSNAEDSIESKLSSIRNSRNSEFEKLMRLPKFGQVLKTVEDVVEEEEEEEEEILLKTPAPVGIYLPNGSKKKCVINGRSAAYYDPQNGVPYSSVESFKTLRDLQDDCYFWTQVDNGGSNSRFRAGVGCYFGKWNGKHAKGVPEGF